MSTSTVWFGAKTLVFLKRLLRRWTAPHPWAAELHRELREKARRLFQLANEARRLKIRAAQEGTRAAGQDLAACRADLKNFCAGDPELRPRFWELVRSFDAALGDRRRRDAGPEFEALTGAIRAWLVELDC
jgi:hypothetical protein